MSDKIIPDKTDKVNQTFNIQDYFKKNERAEELFNCIFKIKNAKYYFSKSSKLVSDYTTEKQLTDLISIDFPEFVKVNEKFQRVLKLDSRFLSLALFNNNIGEIARGTDLFQTEPIAVSRYDDTLSITTNLIHFKEIEQLEDNKDTRDLILADYKEHFPELDTVLEWIVGCRFTESRRQSYLHLRAKAGFGKSFLKEALKKSGIITECRYEDFKSPSSVHSKEFKNSMSLIIDEFTVFKKEFKDMTNKMTLDSKNELRTEVEIFSKIFMSAEQSPSFIGGVDSQISDRMNIINKEEKLELRAVYQDNIEIYHNVICCYIGEYLKNRIEYYISLGKKEATKSANLVMANFHNRYKLKAEDINKIVKDVFFQKIYELMGVEIRNLTDFNDKKIRENIIYPDGVAEHIYIKAPKKVFEQCMMSGDEDFYKKAKYKTQTYEDIIGYKINAFKVNGKTIRAIKINIEQLNKMIEDNQYPGQQSMNYESIDKCPF